MKSRIKKTWNSKDTLFKKHFKYLNNLNFTPHLVHVLGVKLDAGDAAATGKAGAVLSRVRHVEDETILKKNSILKLLSTMFHLRFYVHPAKELGTGVGNCNLLILKHLQMASNTITLFVLYPSSLCPRRCSWQVGGCQWTQSWPGQGPGTPPRSSSCPSSPWWRGPRSRNIRLRM